MSNLLQICYSINMWLDIRNCYYCPAEVTCTFDEDGNIEEQDSKGNIICDECFEQCSEDFIVD